MARKQQQTPDVRQIVNETLRAIFVDSPPQQIEIERQRIDAMEELIKKLSVIITGNGNPENGLVVKQTALSMDVQNFHVETRKEIQQLKDVEKEKRTREWALAMVGIGLIATSLWQILVP